MQHTLLVDALRASRNWGFACAATDLSVTEIDRLGAVLDSIRAFIDSLFRACDRGADKWPP